MSKATVVAVAALFCAEILVTAEPDAPVFQATFDVAPPVDVASSPTDAGQDRRVLQVAHGAKAGAKVITLH